MLLAGAHNDQVISTVEASLRHGANVSKQLLKLLQTAYDKTDRSVDRYRVQSHLTGLN